MVIKSLWEFEGLKVITLAMAKNNFNFSKKNSNNNKIKIKKIHSKNNKINKNSQVNCLKPARKPAKLGL